MHGTDPHGWPLLAAALADMPDVVARLLDTHGDCGTGRCRTCTEGGTGAPHDRWPCTPYSLAAEAARIIGRSRAGSPR